jgi:hypothetical protein
MSRKFTIYSHGLVTCRDQNGRQTPTLQGYFPDVVAAVKQQAEKDQIWVIRGDQVIQESSILKDGIDEREVPFEEWLAFGDSLVEKGIRFQERPIDDRTLEQMRLEKGTVPDESGGLE